MLQNTERLPLTKEKQIHQEKRRQKGHRSEPVVVLFIYGFFFLKVSHFTFALPSVVACDLRETGDSKTFRCELSRKGIKTITVIRFTEFLVTSLTRLIGRFGT